MSTHRPLGAAVVPLETRREAILSAMTTAERLGYDAFFQNETWAFGATLLLAEAAARTTRLSLELGGALRRSLRPGARREHAAAHRGASHDVPFTAPIERMRRTVMRALLGGERIPRAVVDGARPLELDCPRQEIPINLAGLAHESIRLAGEVASGPGGARSGVDARSVDGAPFRSDPGPGRRRRHSWVCALAAAALAGLCAVGSPGAQTAQFPRPDRPVAPIISPAYSTEAARDGHGEAERVLNRLGVKPGMRVADIGAGDGYYTVRLARRLGPGGTIYAEDITQPYLDRLGQRLAREGIGGVTLVHGTPVDPRLPEQSVDLALLAHMYHEIEQPYEFVYRLHAALAPGARVAIIDNDKPTGKHGTPPALLRCELGAVGYRQIDFLWLDPADGYLAVFAPPEVLPRPDAIRPCGR